MDKKIVLCIDDEEVILDFVKIVLEMDNFNVITSNSGENAIKLLQRNDINIDLVLLDLMMPGMNGWETLKKIREIPYRKSTPVVIFTGNLSEKYNLKSNKLSSEISDFILKPVDYEDLIKRIKNILKIK